MLSRRLVNANDYRTAARQRLPRSVFDVIDGGAGDELTLQRNRTAFDAIALRPRAMSDVTHRDLSTSIYGQYVPMPVLLDPCGTARMLHPDGELAVARAAGALGTIYALSTVSSFQLEDVAAVATGALWYQLYPAADAKMRRERIQRAQDAGYGALCVTVDGAVLGTRERDRRNGLKIPFKITPRLMMEGALHPRWAWGFLKSGPKPGVLGRLSSATPSSIDDTGRAIMATANPVTMRMLEEIREQWEGPLIVKGVMRGDEMDSLLERGVDGVIVSNHGGRQLDTIRSSIEILPEVVQAAAGRCDVFLDSGIRRGSDVLKALALGAKAVLIGRPYLFALAVAGQRGVEDVLGMLFEEFDAAMALTGCRSLADIGTDIVQMPHQPTHFQPITAYQGGI